MGLYTRKSVEHAGAIANTISGHLLDIVMGEMTEWSGTIAVTGTEIKVAVVLRLVRGSGTVLRSGELQDYPEDALKDGEGLSDADADRVLAGLSGAVDAPLPEPQPEDGT